MKRFARLIGAVCLAAGFGAAAPAMAETIDLTGVYETPYMPAGGEMIFKLTSSFEGNTHRHRMHVTSEHPMLQYFNVYVDRYWTFEIVRESPDAEGAYEIDKRLVMVTETYLTQEMVDEKNEEAHCGYTDWELNVPKDVTGARCFEDEDPWSAGDMSYDIVALTEDGIIFGQKPWHPRSVGATPNTRPRTLGESIGYRRIEE